MGNFDPEFRGTPLTPERVDQLRRQIMTHGEMRLAAFIHVNHRSLLRACAMLPIYYSTARKIIAYLDQVEVSQ